MKTVTNTKSLDNIFRLESGLQDRSDLLESILSAASIGIGIVIDRVIKDVNPYFCNMLGYTREELIDSSARILYPSDDEYKRVGKIKYRLINDTGEGTIETSMVRKDREILDIRLSSVPIDPSNLSSGVIFTALNISEKKQAERELTKSENRSDNIIKTSPLGIFIYELDKHNDLILKDANPATRTILGHDYQNSIGDPIHVVFPNLSKTSTPDNFKKVARTGKSWSTAELVYDDENVAGTFEILSFRIAPGQVAVMFSDITERKKTEQKLQQSEEKHRKIFQNIQDVYFEMAPDTTILEVSPSVSKISNFTREELIGQPIEMLSVDNKVKDIFLKLLVEKGELPDFDVPLKDKDGRVIYCSINVTLEYNSNGQPFKIIGSLRDITERRLAREKISKLERAVEQSPSSVVITNLEGTIEYVNPKFTEITGFRREEAIGKNPRMMKSGYHKDAFYHRLWCDISSGKEWKGEFHNKRKDGTTFWEMASISPVRNQRNEITHFIAIKDDITDRKIWEQQLQEAKEKAEESDRLKSSFLANMSHEIRTPMNAILGFSGLLKNNDVTEADREEYIDLIITKGNDLMNLISDLIDISRIEAGDMQLSRIKINVNDMISEVFEQTIKEKDFRGKDLVHLRKSISTDKQPIILSDKNRLRQVFNNLLSNALKFTQEGYVEIGAKTVKDFVHFYIKDTGIGIEKDKHNIIFERFRQADDSHTRKYGGTGLGLAISNQIVGLLGGEIWVESNPGQGATFWFTHPLQELKKNKSGIPDMSEIYAARKDPDLKNKKILIAEDDPSNYLFLESMLGSYNAELIWARDGNQAIEIHKNNGHLDLILMDIRMPTLNGLLATKEIRVRDRSIPIIALTAFAFADDREKSRDAGCDEHLTKPVKLDELKYILNKYLA